MRKTLYSIVLCEEFIPHILLVIQSPKFLFFSLKLTVRHVCNLTLNLLADGGDILLYTEPLSIRVSVSSLCRSLCVHWRLYIGRSALPPYLKGAAVPSHIRHVFPWRLLPRTQR
jgi:hypothetical protein